MPAVGDCTTGLVDLFRFPSKPVRNRVMPPKDLKVEFENAHESLGPVIPNKAGQAVGTVTLAD